MALGAAATPLWPGGDVRLEARDGATIEEIDGTIYVQTGRCSPSTYPNVAFVFHKPADLSAARAIRATFTNCTDQALRIALKIHAETEQGRLPDRGWRIPPHASLSFSLPLFLERWTFDRDPKLLGLKRAPHVGDGSSYSLTKVADVVLRELGEAVAEKYYSTIRAAIKRVAPDALYLGDRNDRLNPEVFRAASRHCDVITVNVYDHQPRALLPVGAEDKPLLVTEFHFGCYDTGYFFASLVPVESQRERAECYERYLNAAVDNPNYVGAHWFCWRDCPITGQVNEGANAQCGLVSTADIPYSELVQAIRSVSRTMYERRFRGF